MKRLLLFALAIFLLLFALAIFCVSLSSEVQAAGWGSRDAGGTLKRSAPASQGNAAKATQAISAAMAPGTSAELAAVPFDDAGKWHVILISDGDAYSKHLEYAFRTNPQLKAIAAWGHYNVYQHADASQRERVLSYALWGQAGADIAQVPAVAPVLSISTPQKSTWYPNTFVYRREFGRTGWDGDYDRLAIELLDQIRAFAAKYQPSQTPVGWGRFRCNPPAPCPDPLPTPTPTPAPLTPIVPLPDVLPDLPLLPPNPSTPKGSGGAKGDFPLFPCVTVIYDESAVGEDGEILVLKSVAEHLAGQIDPLQNPKVRIVAFGSPDAEPFPCAIEDTPCVFVTQQGNIIGSLNRAVVRLLGGRLNYGNLLPVPAPPQCPVPGTGFDAYSLSDDQIAALRERLGLNKSVFYVEHRDPKTDAIIPQVDPRTGAVYQTQSMYWGDTYTLYLPQLSNPAVKSEESR